MYYGRDSEYGYVYFGLSEEQIPSDGEYLAIPREKKWYTFRRL